jgi:hypothetical protein
MTSRAKRLTFILAIVAVVAVIAGIAMGPELLAAPKEKAPDGGSFTIKTSETWICATSDGTFEATGALEGSGTARGGLCWYNYNLTLRDESGWMSMVYTPGKHGTFTVVHADGAYAGLVGATGSYRDKVTNDRNESGDPFGTISRTLQGSVPE